MSDIKVYGKLVNKTGDGIIADAKQIAYNGTNIEDSFKELNEELKNSKLTKEINVVASMDLNSVMDSGIYNISTATNAPDETKVSGVLSVSDYSNEKIKQIWESENQVSYRYAAIQKNVSDVSTLTVNGENATIVNKTVTLASGGTYILAGYLNGHIEIGTSTDTPSESTLLIMDGVSIFSDVERAIHYLPTGKSLEVKLKENSENYLMSTTLNEMIDSDSSACILSENNIKISGVGLLAVDNKYGGHGIKAEKDLSISGQPYLHIDCHNGHDGLHGSDSVTIEEGFIKIANVNDAVGTGSSGVINVYGGTIKIDNCKEDGFDSKGLGGVIQGLTTKLYFDNIAGNLFSNLTVLDTVEISNPDNNAYIIKTAQDFYGTARVYIATDDDTFADSGTNIELVDGVYTTSATAVVATGYIENPIILTSKSSSLCLKDAFIKTDAAMPAIHYLPTDKKLEIDSFPYADGELYKANYVINTNIVKKTIVDSKSRVVYEDHSAISSGNNLDVNTDILIYTMAASGNGLSGDTLTIRGDGNKYVVNSGLRGIRCKEGLIGWKDAKDSEGNDILDENGDNINDVTASHDQNIYAIGNFTNTDTETTGKINESADLCGINTDGTKGTFLICATQKGIVLTGSMRSIFDSTIENSTAENIRGDVYAEYLGDSVCAGTISGTYITYNTISNYENPTYPFSLDDSLVGVWTTLKQTPDIDFSPYVTTTELDKRILKFSDLDTANEYITTNQTEYGTLVSIYTGASTDYASDYNAYIVARDSSGNRALKLVSGGSTTNTGTLVFAVDEIYIDGVKADTSSEYLECNIGSTIKFVYTFESQYYADARGLVYLKEGATAVITDKIYPDGESHSIEYSTSALTAGTYTYTLYGVESTGRQSDRTSFKFRVGGLNISSTYDENTILTVGSALSLPISVVSANTSVTINAHAKFDGTEILNEAVSAGNNTLNIQASYITEGTHTLEVYLVDSDGKISNSVTFNLIAAISGKVYAITDKNIYSASEGTKLSIVLRVLELGYEEGKYKAILTMKDSTGAVATINDATSKTYTLNFGENLIDLVNLKYLINDGTTENMFSTYTAIFAVTSIDDESAIAAEKEITINISQSNYNISTVTSGLACEFKSAGNSNLSETRNSWADSSGNNIGASFNNFNWVTNGWLNDSMGNTALTLNSGAYVELDIKPFENEITTGMTISIDFSTKDILNSSAKVISCLYEYDGSDTETYYLRDIFGDYVASGDENIKNFFKYTGGYCWIDGVTYEADNTTSYEVTFVETERAINYNLGDANTSYDGTTDFKKFIGSIQKAVTKQKGFYIDTQYAVLSNSSSQASAEDKFHLNFSEDTRTRIDLIISRVETAGQEVYYFPSMIGYTNGVLSLMQQITDLDTFAQTSPKGTKFKIYLGCKAVYDDYGNITTTDTGSAKIYSFRIYNRALNPEEILKNYAAEVPDLETKKSIIDNNGLVNSDTLAKLPQICLVGAEMNGTSTINDFIMQLVNDSSMSTADLKAMRAPAYLTYTDPDNTDNNWYVDANKTDNLIPIKLQFQGTSSLVYPLKNYKFKCYNTFDISGDNVTYGNKLKFDIGNGIKESTFTLKADFMDSSHCNNTGSANFIADYNEITGETPANRLDNAIRTTVYGYPVLMYYKEKSTDQTQHFIGVGNLNLDKSDNASFGLKNSIPDTDGIEMDFGQPQFIDDDFSSDILEKTTETITLPDGATTKDYIKMVKPGTNIAVAALSEKGYLRTVNNDELPCVTCSEYKANSGALGAGGFGNYNVESIAADTELRSPDDGDLEDDEYANYIARVGAANALSFVDFKSPYYYATQRMIKWVKNASETEFIQNIDRHFNRNYLMDYYLTILLLGGVDSLGKNLMMTTWGPENRLYITTEAALDNTNALYDKFAFRYTNDDSSEIIITPTVNKNSGEYAFAKNSLGKPLYYKEECFNRYNNAFESGFSAFEVTDIPGESIFYPMFYDIDTICGLDNSGQLLYDVDIELGDSLDDGTAVFNTADSKLWSKVKDYLGKVDSNNESLLSSRWSTLRITKFTVDNLVGKFYYQKQISKIPEKYYNNDNMIKYIYEGPSSQKGSGSYLYCIHGSRYEQIKRWYSQRIYYLDAMFGKVGTTAASMRFNHGKADANFGDTLDYYTSYSQLAATYPEYYTYDTTSGKLLNSVGREIVPITYNFKTYQPGYVGIKWFNGGNIHMIRVHRDDIATLVGNVKTTGDAEVFVYGGSNIKEIGDMYEYNVKQVDFKNLTKLNKLVLGATGYSCVINKLDLGTNSYMSDLQLINCGSLSSINVENCINLKNLDMTGSAITSASLASGGALQSIAYSNAVTSINLNNFSNLSSITATNLNNLTSFVIKDCPKILGTKSAPTARAWSLLQQTYNTSALTTIEVESYGAVEPKMISDSSYLFLDKFYDYSTSSKIKGELYYNGTVVPENYTKYSTAYPDLHVTYNNITDASNMFEDFKNINLIGTLQVYTGKDIYGNNQYTTAKYWIDADAASKEKWHNEAMYLKYGSSTSYTSSNMFYIISSGDSVVYYRMLGIYDDEDLAAIRAEIKDHVSQFKRFTNINYMFKNCSILDYIDADTFNNVDISSATSDGLFYGCIGLKYFETPGDIVKNETRTRYKDENGNIVDITNLTAEEIAALTKEDYFYNPYTETEVETETSTAIKGLRNIGDDAFYNCKEAKIYIKKLSNTDKIRISETAFEYPCYDPNATTQVSGVTFERPVILFEEDEKDMLQTTTSATSTYENTDDPTKPIIWENSPVSGVEGKYYSRSIKGERILNTSNQYITLASGAWLREVYFGISKIVLNDTTLDSALKMSYAEDSSGNRILFDVVSSSESPITNFNDYDDIDNELYYTNKFKLKSLCQNSLANLPNVTIIQIPLQQYDNLDPNRYRFDQEYSAIGLFTDKFFSIDSAETYVTGTLKEVYFVNTKTIFDSAFSGFSTLEKIGFSSAVEKIEASAFKNCSNITNILWYNRNSTISYGDNANVNLTMIGNDAFSGCSSLKLVNIPNKVTSLGTSCFANCSALAQVDYSSALTIVPDSTFQNCTLLSNVSSFSTNITSFGSYSFGGCSNLKLVKDDGSIIFAENGATSNFNYFTGLLSIGDNAFYNCRGIIPSQNNEASLLKFPNTIQYIGSYAFYQVLTAPISDSLETEISWEGNGKTDYVNLVIGAYAFANIRICWNPTTDASTSSNLIKDCVYIPKLSGIGDSAFKTYGDSVKFNICLAENSETEIGSSWANVTKKIIFNYAGLTSQSTTGMTATYLLSSNGTKNVAYLEKITQRTSGAITVPATIIFSDITYTIIQILSGAFDGSDITTVSGLTFDSSSQLELIESDVLTSTNAANLSSIIFNGSTGIPSTLSIESGNYLTYWKNIQTATNGFITLGKYIVGYNETSEQLATSYTLDLTDSAVSACSVIYDEAFKGKNCNAIIFNSNITKISTKAFSGTKISEDVASLVLPETLTYIGSEAFRGCKIKNLFIPKLVETVEADAFNEALQGVTLASGGSLESVQFEAGCALASGSPFTLQKEVHDNDANTDFNVTLKTLILPPAQAWILTTGFNNFSIINQATNLYLGNLELNPDDNTIYCENYKLYEDASGNTTYTADGNTAKTQDGKQVYCYKFYKDMVDKAGLSGENLFLETTDEKSPCPVGDIDSTHLGVAKDINLSNIRAILNPTVKAGITLTDEQRQYKDFTRENLLMAIAGFTSDATSRSTPYKIRLRMADKTVISNDIALLTGARYITFDFIA